MKETLADCFEKVLKLGEEKEKQTFKSSTEFLLSGINVEGLKSEKFDIQYDTENSQINNSNGQVFGKILYDGTLKCGEEIYNRDDELKELNKAFITAKVEVFTETYGELATYKDVKYDPISYFRKKISSDWHCRA